mgnify:CR=1 FL=1
MTESFAEKMKAGTRELNITLSQRQLEQFFKYYEMLVETNKVMNLTAITEFDEVVEKHFLDSVSLTKQMDLHQPLKVLDLGTGAAFPGIPLKIVFPELEITLMDSLNKRVLFLQDVISSLQLENIEAVHGRAEEAARNKKYRESFDLCVSRAVANISTLSEYCLPFVKIGGSFISYKSSTIEDELEDGKKGIAILGGKVKDVYKFTLPDSELQRSFVIIEKEKKTPKAYPRKAGTPSKEPLH